MCGNMREMGEHLSHCRCWLGWPKLLSGGIVICITLKLFPNSLSPWKIPEDLHEIMEVGVSWELDDVF